MKRKMIGEIMTTYLPSTLSVAITFATTFFKPFFFEAALSVNLTTMLVMTTIFISKMEGLPSTSDIKMIDIWLVLCQMVPFAEVVLLTAREYHRDDEQVRNTFMNGEEVELEGKRWQKCRVPTFRTIGKNISIDTTDPFVCFFVCFNLINNSFHIAKFVLVGSNWRVY